jgi:outer membrane protein OmpA-like peptidoglycan-associated protein
MKKIYFLIVFSLQVSFSCFSQDTLFRYTDAEVIKLANHVKELEKRTSAYSATQYNAPSVENNAAERQILADLLSDSLHRYTDRNVIKLARYIRNLEKLDSLNTVAIAKAKIKAKVDSLATVAAITKTKVGEEVNLGGEGENIEKYEKFIYFDFNSAALTKDSNRPLDDVVTILKKHDKLKFVIEGHTDSVGTAPYNLSLSKRRAESVKSYFVSKGIPASLISTVGYGKGKPVDTNLTEQGRAKNRRVAIKAVKAKK